jgi:hypothetical protein
MRKKAGFRFPLVRLAFRYGSSLSYPDAARHCRIDRRAALLAARDRWHSRVTFTGQTGRRRLRRFLVCTLCDRVAQSRPTALLRSQTPDIAFPRGMPINPSIGQTRFRRPR